MRVKVEMLAVDPEPIKKSLVILPEILLRLPRKPARPGYLSCSWCSAEVTNFGQNPAVKGAPVLCPRCFGVETYKGRKLIFGMPAATGSISD